MSEQRPGPGGDPNDGQWERLWEIFHEVREAAADDRATLLARLCGDDAELRLQVEALLATETREADVLDHSESLRLDLLEAARSGEQLGRYTIVGKLGEGGAGSVYRARRTDGELEQEVAIKVLRLDATTPEMLERFERERQILAQLEHPNIARVLDAGGRNEARPFVALELIDGEPIDRFCRHGALDVRTTIEVFLDVCAAVSYSHRHLIVHRDLKPSNILVEADGTPKLLDFGIAKPVAADLTQTATAARLLTPRYASPEQIGGGAITTTSDVYSLGVILYELLVGESPYGKMESNPLELVRKILEDDPERPSTALTSGGASASVALLPQDRGLQRDLDAIVLKALAKEPERRYSTVDELAADLRRFLDGQAVEARPDSLVYRLGKLVRRHRLAAAATAALLIVVLGAAISTSLLSLRLAHAVNRERDERRKAEQTSRFLVDLFRAADPDRARGQELSARQVLREGAARIQSQSNLAPAVRAEVGRTIFTALLHLDALDEAEEVLEQALAPLSRELGGLEPVWTQLHRAQLLGLRGDRQAAIGTLGLGLVEVQIDQGLESRRLQVLLRAQLSTHLFLTGDRTAGLAELDQVMEYAESTRDEPVLLDAMVRLADALRENGELERAELLLRRGLAIHQESRSEPSLASAKLQESLGLVLADSDRLPESRTLLEAAIADFERILGTNSPRLLYNNYGIVLHRQGEHELARGAFERALESSRDYYGPDSAALGPIYINTGWLLHDLGDFWVAERSYLEALRITLKGSGPEGQNLIPIFNNLGLVHLDQGDPEGARAFLDRGVELVTTSFGPEHPALAFLRTNQARLEHELGNRQESERLYRQALRIRRTVLPSGHSDLGLTLTGLGGLLCEDGRFEEGEALLQEALQIRQDKHRPRDWRTALTENELGMCLQLQGRQEEARHLIAGSVERILAQRGDRDPRARRALERLEALDDS